MLWCNERFQRQPVLEAYPPVLKIHKLIVPFEDQANPVEMVRGTASSQASAARLF
jgi:hypothetical protein